MNKYKFNVGDRIKRVRGGSYGKLKEGDEAIVAFINLSLLYIEGDKCYEYDPDYFELVKPKSEIVEDFQIY